MLIFTNMESAYFCTDNMHNVILAVGQTYGWG